MCCTSPALLQCWPFVRSCKSHWCKLYPSSDNHGSVEHGSISNMIVSFHFGWIFPLNNDYGISRDRKGTEFTISHVSGLVVDSGDTVTRSLPVYDGFLLTNAVQQLDVGGRDITTYMLQSLREQNEHHFFSQRRGFKIADTRIFKRMLVRDNAREVSAPGDFQGCLSLLKNSSFRMWKLHEDHMHHDKVFKDRTIDYW